MTLTKPLASTALASTWNFMSQSYTDEVAPHFAAFADAALDDLGIDISGDEGVIVDVACGPGTVAARALSRGLSVKGIDFSDEMIARANRAVVDPRASFVVGDGQALPFADDEFDGAVSLFGLMFFPDRHAGLRELWRVLRPGARAAVTAWVPTDEVPIYGDAITLLMKAAAQIDPTKPKPTKVTPPLSSPTLMQSEFERAGFVDVAVHQQSVLVPFESPTAFLHWMERTAPLVAMKQAMGDAAFGEVFLRWNVAMMSQFGGLPIEVPLIALFGVGAKPT